jgi:4-amino-4-deoxy-L-arabinose transferase-like glycosyltransferase
MWIIFSIIAALPIYLVKLITDHALFYITSYDNGSIWHSKILSALGGSYFDYSFMGFMLLPFILFPFFVVGVYFCVKSKEQWSYFLFSWILALLLCFSFLVAFKVPRYAIYFLVPMILVASYGFYLACGFLLKKSRLSYILIALFFVCLLLYSESLVLDNQKGESYGVGLKEAALWLKQNADGNSIILASSRREMRLFSGFEYVEDKGIIYQIPLTKADFESIINDNANDGKKIFMVADVYDFTQNSWIFPMSSDLEHSLNEKGFFRADTILLKNMPRVYIFVRSSV